MKLSFGGWSDSIPFIDCDRTMAGHAYYKRFPLAICLKGNGEYWQGAINATKKTDWFPKGNVPEQISFICSHENNKQIRRATLYLPSRSEKNAGFRPRLDLPCTFDAEQVIAIMSSATKVLSKELSLNLEVATKSTFLSSVSPKDVLSALNGTRESQFKTPLKFENLYFNVGLAKSPLLGAEISIERRPLAQNKPDQFPFLSALRSPQITMQELDAIFSEISTIVDRCVDYEQSDCIPQEAMQHLFGEVMNPTSKFGDDEKFECATVTDHSCLASFSELEQTLFDQFNIEIFSEKEITVDGLDCMDRDEMFDFYSYVGKKCSLGIFLEKKLSKLIRGARPNQLVFSEDNVEEWRYVDLDFAETFFVASSGQVSEKNTHYDLCGKKPLCWGRLTQLRNILSHQLHSSFKNYRGPVVCRRATALSYSKDGWPIITAHTDVSCSG